MKIKFNKIISIILSLTFSFSFFYSLTPYLTEKVFAETSSTTTNPSMERYRPTLEDDFKEDQIIVTLTEEYSEINKPIPYLALQSASINIESVEDLTYIENLSTTIDTSRFSQILSITLSNPSKENVLSAIDEIEKLDFVLAAEPSYNYTTINLSSPNDSFYTNQWGLNHLNGSAMEKVWDFTTGNSIPRIRVGIFENNIQGNHPDLRVVSGNFTPSANASTSHGTHVGGIIGAISNNNLGISGIAQVEIALLNRNHNTFVDTIKWAIENNIKIINASYYYTKNSNGEPSGPEVAHAEILEWFSDNGGIFIAAAGNDGRNQYGNSDDSPHFPAGYADKHNYPMLDNVISVGSLNENQTRSTFSNYGENSVNIYAPGENILSAYPTTLCLEYDYIFYDGTRACELDSEMIEAIEYVIETYDTTWEFIDEHFTEIFVYNGVTTTPADYIAQPHQSNGYHYMSGTSMAAPHVTGVAALLLSYNPDLTAAQLKSAIINGADTIQIEIPDGDDEDTNPDAQTVKKLNATKALQYVMDNYGDSVNLKFNDKTFSKAIDANSSYFEESNCMLMMNVTNAYEYDFSVSSTSAVDITLYDENLDEISISTTSINGGCQIEFSEDLSIGKYYLQASYVSETATGTIEITISGEPHTHEYNDKYVSLGSSGHSAFCECGAGIVQAHAVNGEDPPAKRRCIKCNQLVLPGDEGFIIMSLQAQYVTANGSFIAPDGVIYLVETDIEAYLNDTLVFYKKDDLPLEIS